MQSSLILSDTKKFIDKYTRFMTKDIYISYDMCHSFLSRYLYLKDELSKNKYLYQEQNDYKNFFRIFRHNDEMLRLHNEKYLKNAVSRYDDFFDGLYSKDVLDKNKKMMVLASEDKMVSVVVKNYIPLIVSKIKYMHDYSKWDLSKILVLVNDDVDMNYLKKELDIYEVSDVVVDQFDILGKSTLKDGESLLDMGALYQELFRYIVLDIYADKERFTRFYEAFSDYLYLNRDYKNFDTFRDYHYYMYKRMFLESGLSLKKYNEREIRKRRGHLRTIDNVFVSNKEMVDVANFLYLNSIDYQYDNERDCLICKSSQSSDVIYFDDGILIENGISLDRKGKFLEDLVYELIKRQYGMERRSDEDIYQMFFQTTMDSYFSELIQDILIPGICYYKKYHSFDDSIFNEEQIGELKQFCDCYDKFMENNSFVDDDEFYKRVKDELEKSKYEYIIMVGRDDFVLKKNHLVILKNYPEVSLLKGNARMMYEYKMYLNEKKCLFLPHCYLGFDELHHLTKMFLRVHLNFLNGFIEKNQSHICVCFYDDNNRLRYALNLASKVYDIVSSCCDKKVIFGFSNKNEIKSLIQGDYFVKDTKDTLKCDCGSFLCCGITHIDKKYDVIVLPSLIKKNFYKGVKKIDDVELVKIGLFTALNKCRDKVYLLCPLSRKEHYVKVFSSFLDVEYMI